MISQTVQNALNEQIKNETYSAYLYLSMSAHFEHENLQGAAHWMRAQAGEEMEHALKIFDYITDQGGQVTLQAIPQPPSQFGSVLSVFEQSLEHEQKVTTMIHDLYGLASRENDYATQGMLQWFVGEQVEEEKSVTQIIEELRLVGENGTALFMVDRQLAARAG